MSTPISLIAQSNSGTCTRTCMHHEDGHVSDFRLGEGWSHQSSDASNDAELLTVLIPILKQHTFHRLDANQVVLPRPSKLHRTFTYPRRGEAVCPD